MAEGRGLAPQSFSRSIRLAIGAKPLLGFPSMAVGRGVEPHTREGISGFQDQLSST